ncbi:nucleotide disphospho-sugar-binding domain-containing protein [Rhizohabitans arisaemae]|uniref:nucleotide disphospho-sugar-binding domain-containing protein n=1 Tax=Rhizohabitans arisaemae TaxID=2720610 RepID=UPI0024B1E660|nr:nucleotide disphospho-sugar-binding domain-containing protein [Rhizohabitans arisaemae]
MRVAIAMWPAPAHLYPFTPLAWALRAAGHEVFVVSHPCFGDAVSEEGLSFAAICDPDVPPPFGPGGVYPEERAEIARITEAMNLPVDQLVNWNTFSQFFLPSMWDFTRYRGSATDSMPVMDGMVRFFREWRPDLVIWDPCFPGAGVAARACGARHARFSGPDIVGWSIETFQRIAAEADVPPIADPMVETLRAMGEKYDVPIDRETLLGNFTINPMPPSVQAHLPVDTRMVPVRWLAHSKQSASPAWLYPVPDRPRVALSLGVSMRAFLAADWNYVPMLLDALGGLDVEVVATLNDNQLANVTKIPDNVRVVEYVPLNQLAPTCSAVIHHGGLATMAGAASARVPQLVVDFLDLPVIAETSEDGVVGATRYALAPTTGKYVTDHGAGGVLDMSKASVEGIRDQVMRVLTEPSYKAGANRLHEDQIAAPSPRDLVPVLETLTLSV